MDLNKYIVTTDNNNPLHSSGIAVTANSDRLGATSAVSFNQRKQIENNRCVIGGYQRSLLGTAHGVLRAKIVDKEDLTRNQLKVPKRPTLQQHNATLPTRHFSEPTARGHDPYA